jgi:hypothetical protein
MDKKESVMKQTKYLLLGVSILLFVVIAPGSFSAEPSQEPACVIEKLVMARTVENREPVGEGVEFDAASGKVYCWMKVNCPSPPTTIKHVWYQDDRKVFQLVLEVKYATMRTWSVKGIAPGNWRVDVIDEADQVMGSVKFQVK